MNSTTGAITMRVFSLTVLALLFLPFVIYAQNLPTIDSFTVDNNALDYAMVEAGYEEANFSWQASGLRSGDSMEMHAWVNGDWVLIGEDFEPIKTDSLVIAHPLSFELPRYRLSIVDSAGQRIAENILELHYAEPSRLPFVDYFLTREYTLPPQAILEDEGVAIHWRVSTRWHRSTIYFEQVFSDGRVIDIAVNNPNEWRRATDSGVLYPEYEGDGIDVVLRLRLVNIDTGETLAEKDHVLPLIREDVPQPELISFTVSPAVGRRGGTATLSWEVANAQRVFINQRTPTQNNLSMCRHNGGWSADIIYEDLPTTGSLEIQIPAEAYGQLRFQIVADRYLTGEYSCEPRPLLGEIFLDLESYNSFNPLVRQIGMSPSMVTVAGGALNLTWDVSEGQSIMVTQGSGYTGEVDQTFSDLPLTGSLEIVIPDTVRVRQESYVWITVYLIRDGVEPENIWNDAVNIDPDDNLSCVSYLRTEPPTIAPVVPLQDIAVSWDGCGSENLLLRMLMEDPDNNYTVVVDEIQNVGVSGSQTMTVPNRGGVLRFVLYRVLDGQQIELQRASLYVESE
jgi:hypothetical protein